MNPVLEKAKELGDEIEQSQELQEMKSAQLNVMNDPEAKAIVDDFQQKQQFYYNMQQQGQELTDEQKQEAQELEQKMSNNPVIAEYIRSQQKFEQLLEEINNIISKSIQGEQSSGCNDDCCTSCGTDCDA